MHLVQHVTAEQQRGWLVRRDRLETRRRLLGHFVVARVVRQARPGDEAVSELFGGARGGAPLAQVLLQLRDVGVAAGVGGDRDQAGAIEVSGEVDLFGEVVRLQDAASGRTRAIVTG